MDVMQDTKMVKIPVTEIGSVPLPSDFVDIVRVGYPVGAWLKPINADESMNRMYNYDDSGNKIPYEDVSAYYPQMPFSRQAVWYSNRVNDKGEFLGGVYNNKPSYKNSYVLSRERCELQLNPAYNYPFIVLEYVTDGTSCDACTIVHPYALKTIETYIIWQMKEHSRSYSPQERELARGLYVAEYDRLQGRMNPIGTEDIIRSLRRGYGGQMKS